MKLSKTTIVERENLSQNITIHEFAIVRSVVRMRNDVIDVNLDLSCVAREYWQFSEKGRKVVRCGAL
jgi:hypothetical protein